MKMIYHILYKNGTEEEFEMKVDEHNHKKIMELNNVIEICMREDESGCIHLGDGRTEGNFIRMSEVIRIKMEYKENEVRN